MALPTMKPTDAAPAQSTQRHHSDPPGLWVAVFLGSIAIHAFAFWMLRLLPTGSLLGGHSAKVLIPVDVVAVPAQAASSTQRTQKPGVTAISKTSTRSPNRQTSSASTVSSTRANSQQKGTQSSSPSRNSAKKQSQGISARKPASNSSQKQPGSKTSSTKPNASTNKGTQSGGSGTASPPSPAPPKGTPGGSNSPDFQQGGISVSPGKLDIVEYETDRINFGDGDNDRNKRATLKQNNTRLSSNDLKRLGISLDRVVELKVVILVQSTGEATVYPTSQKPNSLQVLRGDISKNAAERLTRFIVEQWRFNPTRSEGQFVDRDYSLTITISPS